LNSVNLDYMSWMEFKNNLESIEVAIIPTGSCEQHGPNQTFATDTIRAKGVAELVAKELKPKVVVCPTVPYGISPHHMKFPGTITLGIETYISLLTDIAVSLKSHGIKKIVFLNGHGGNTHSLGAVCAKLYHEHGIKSAYSQVGTGVVADYWEKKNFSKIRGHACESEVSQSLYLDPRVVKVDDLEPGEIIDKRFENGPPWAEYFWPFHEVTSNGALGDATKASKEYGKEMTEKIVRKVSDFITEYFL